MGKGIDDRTHLSMLEFREIFQFQKKYSEGENIRKLRITWETKLETKPYRLGCHGRVGEVCYLVFWVCPPPPSFHFLPSPQKLGS